MNNPVFDVLIGHIAGATCQPIEAVECESRTRIKNLKFHLLRALILTMIP
jgi:hypothetical protein